MKRGFIWDIPILIFAYGPKVGFRGLGFRGQGLGFGMVRGLGLRLLSSSSPREVACRAWPFCCARMSHRLQK